MKQTKHTPGPFIVSKDSPYEIEAGPDSLARSAKIGRVYDSSDFPCLETKAEERRCDAEAAANARLFAAAPTLLAHIQDAIFNCEQCRGITGDTGRCARCQTFIADVALATARPA